MMTLFDHENIDLGSPNYLVLMRAEIEGADSAPPSSRARNSQTLPRGRVNGAPRIMNDQ